MTHAEFRAARARLGMGRGEFAAALGISYRTALRMASGKRPIGPETEAIIRQMLAEADADLG